MDELEDDDDEEEHDAVVEFEDDGALSFGRFVTLLGLATHEGGRAIRDLDIEAYWRRLPDEDTERLFRDVLPGHPTLREISLSIGHLPARHLRLLTEAIPTEAGSWPLSSLRLGPNEDWIDIYPDDFDDNVQAIADTLNRNAAVTRLSFSFLMLSADQCRLICRALPHNANVRDLILCVQEVFADTFDGVETSSLRQLSVTGPFSEETVRPLARQLRTNTTLESLSIARAFAGDTSCDDARALLDLVRTYNYTLRSLQVSMGFSHDDNDRFRTQVDAILRRNERIRNVLQELQDPGRNVPPQVLAQLLGTVSTFPTLLHRFLKRYYVNVVTDRLLARGVGGETGGRRGRRRPRAPDF